MIFSIGITTIPCAPTDLRLLIFSQKSCSDITVWTATQPSSANGTTVGLLTPGSNSRMEESPSFFTLRTTYFVSLALKTDWIRCKNSQTISCSVTSFLPIRIACEYSTSTKGSNPLFHKVLAVDTMSQIESLKPKPGPISTDHDIVRISVWIL